MKKENNLHDITRKEFLIASAVGAAMLLLPTSKAFGAERLSLIDDYPDEIKQYLPDVAVSENEEINAQNKKAIDAWAEAVEKALAEGSEIITVEGTEEPVVLARAYYSPVAHKQVGYWPNSCTLGLNATYTTTGNAITAFHGATSFAATGGASVVHLNYSRTIIDGGRTLVVNYSTQVTWQAGTPFATTEVIVSTVEFYTNGGTWLRA